MAPYAKTYEVGITYCNDVNFTHNHEELKEATEEYGKLLGEAIEPVGENRETVHIRLLTLLFSDEERKLVRHVDSGVFPCKHKPEETNG